MKCPACGGTCDVITVIRKNDIVQCRNCKRTFPDKEKK